MHLLGLSTSRLVAAVVLLIRHRTATGAVKADRQLEDHWAVGVNAVRVTRQFSNPVVKVAVDRLYERLLSRRLSGHGLWGPRPEDAATRRTRSPRIGVCIERILERVRPFAGEPSTSMTHRPGSCSPT